MTIMSYQQKRGPYSVAELHPKQELEPNLRRSFAKPSSGHGFRMLLA